MKKDKNIRKSKYITSLFIRCLISVILFLGCIIFVKSNTKNKELIKDQVFTKNFSFATVNKYYKKYLGSILPFDNTFASSKPVFNETFNYQESSKYNDGTRFIVDEKYLMPALHSGIVVFIGQKDNYGDTIIVQGTDGVDIWYCNVNTSLKLYDYVKKDSLIGEVKDNQVILVLQKKNEYLEFSDYAKEI